MTAYKKIGKTATDWGKFGLTDRERPSLHRAVIKIIKSTAAKEIKTKLTNSIKTKTVRRELQK